MTNRRIEGTYSICQLCGVTLEGHKVKLYKVKGRPEWYECYLTYAGFATELVSQWLVKTVDGDTEMMRTGGNEVGPYLMHDAAAIPAAVLSIAARTAAESTAGRLEAIARRMRYEQGDEKPTSLVMVERLIKDLTAPPDTTFMSAGPRPDGLDSTRR